MCHSTFVEHWLVDMYGMHLKKMFFFFDIIYEFPLIIKIILDHHMYIVIGMEFNFFDKFFLLVFVKI